MRYISLKKKLPKPNILVENEKKWLDVYLKKLETEPNARPQNAQYAHDDIKSTLESCSHKKCFYCEKQQNGLQVDHYQELAAGYQHLAFSWENLYLACSDCNQAKKHRTNLQALNPCEDVDTEIEKHLCFEKGIIRANNNSEKGLNTIAKFKLDRKDLEADRREAVNDFLELCVAMQRKAMEKGKKQLGKKAVQELKNYANADRPFSLMFRLLLKKHNF